jgi:hypothetical protein
VAQVPLEELLAAWVPDAFWQAIFLSNDPNLAKIEVAANPASR